MKILKTLALYPIRRQHTEIIELFGQKHYTVDLAYDDFFNTMIDMRIEAQNEFDDPLTPDDRKASESFQNGLKIAANGTSYGVPNEFIVDDHLAEVPTTVYFGGMSAKVKARAHSVGMDGDELISDYKAEKAGRYYAPFGVLIPAAGRLLLGIAERLAADRGLTYAFCDTDSMAFCDYFKKYSREGFREKVQEITNWLQPLNPYKNDVRLFGFEKVNFKLKDHVSGEIVKGEHEPLYCLAVSAKRYCLFNLDKDGLPIIRKASGHGLGDVMLPTGYKARFEHLAAPVEKGVDWDVAPGQTWKPKQLHSKLVAGSAAPLFLDMWYAAIMELREKGTLDGIDKIVCAWPELSAPQHCQTSLSTRDAWLHYQKLPNRRAFQFFETLPAPMLTFEQGSDDPELMWAEMQEAEKSSLYTAYSKPFELDFENLYRRDTNELIKPYLDEGMRLTTVADRIRRYFAHGEAKSEGKIGLLKRKCVVGLSKAWIGKESHPLADIEDLPDDETLETYKAGVEIIEAGLNHDLIARAGITEIAKAARIDESLLVDVVMGQKGLRPDLMARLQQAISVDADGRIEVIKVPITKQETDIERVDGILKKGKQFRELGKFIHASKSVERANERFETGPEHGSATSRASTARVDAGIIVDLEARRMKEPENEAKINALIEVRKHPTRNWCGVTHKDILKDLDKVMRCPPKFLTLTEVETYAKKFYGIEKRLATKSDRKAKQAEWFKTTAHNARARRDKSRAKSAVMKSNGSPSFGDYQN